MRSSPMVRNDNHAPEHAHGQPPARTTVLELRGSARYEELAGLDFDLGLGPGLGRLQAVVHIKRPADYGDGDSTADSREYVRFHLSFDLGVTWHDQGMVDIAPHDTPTATSPQLHAVSLPALPAPERHHAVHVILVRAILSWNEPPPEHAPDFTPVWGQVRDARVLLDPVRVVSPGQGWPGAAGRSPVRWSAALC